MCTFIRQSLLVIAASAAVTVSHAMAVSATATVSAGGSLLDTQTTSQLIQVRAEFDDGRDVYLSSGVSYGGYAFPAMDTQLSASASIVTGNRYGAETQYGSAHATWNFEDSFTLAVAGVEAGTYGTMTATIRLVPFSMASGAVGGVAPSTSESGWDSWASWQVSSDLRSHDGAAVLGQTHRDFSGSRVAGSDSSSSYTYGGGLFELTIPVRFGQPVDFEIQVLLSASTAVASEALVRTEGAANANLEFSWAGISQLVTADGVAVQAFSAYSPSTGWNYAVGLVPEPTAGAMLCLGLLVLRVAARRQR